MTLDHLAAGRMRLVGRLQYWNGSNYVDVTAPLSLSKAELEANPLHFISSGAEPAAVSRQWFCRTVPPDRQLFVVVASDNSATLDANRR
jgi:hypothetical protein